MLLSWKCLSPGLGLWW